MVQKFRHQCTVYIRPCQFVARVKTFIQLSEAAPGLAASGCVTIIAIESFAGFDIIDKLIEKIPDIGTSGFLFFSLNPLDIGFFLLFLLSGIFLCLLRFYFRLSLLWISEFFLKKYLKLA